jgi:hypothetical protein
MESNVTISIPLEFRWCLLMHRNKHDACPMRELILPIVPLTLSIIGTVKFELLLSVHLGCLYKGGGYFGNLCSFQWSTILQLLNVA